MQFEQVYDETDYIYDAVSLVTENVYEASLLTVVVLLFFLRSISILVIGLSIPISVVTTFIVLNALGRSLNIVMLAGLAFAVVTSLTTRSWCWRTSSAATGRWENLVFRRPWMARARSGARFWPRR